MIRISTHVDSSQRNQIIRDLQRIGISANEVLDEASGKGADVVCQEAKRRVVKVSWNLHDSIETTTPRATSKVKNSSTSSVKVNLKKAPYGRKIEYGSYKNGKRQKGQGYLRGSFDSKYLEASDAVNDTVSEAIGRVVR